MTHPDGPHTTRPPTLAPRAMVSTPHHLASASGVEVLRRGGSAVDALIAANAVLCVVYPHWCGVGGDGFWMVHDPRDGSLRGIDASGPAARAATRDFYRERGHAERIPTHGGAAALTVPGAVDGWRLAHERYGRLPWAEFFGDAVRYAREGVPVSRSLAYWLANRQRELRRWPPGEIFFPGGVPPRTGERFALPELAGSLEQIARGGAREALYEGPLAERICAGLEGSPLRPEDFAAFRAEWVEPLRAAYRDVTVCQMPPSTQGLTALQLLKLVEGFDVSAWHDSGADYFHHLAEAVKLAFADRDAWLADPRFVDVPVERLLADDYLARRRGLIDARWAHEIGRVEPGIPFHGSARRGAGGGDTVYLCAVDGEGGVASAIQSLFKDFGSMAYGGGTGIVLQNRGAAFSLDDSAANRLEPGKRPFHTLIPAMLLRDGRPYLAFGTMGGNGQPQTHAALVTRLVDFGYDVQQAIEAPRWVVGETLGESEENLYLEGRVPDPVARELMRRGHRVRMVLDWQEDMGHAQAIRIHPEGGFLEGGADPRGDGAALGY